MGCIYNNFSGRCTLSDYEEDEDKKIEVPVAMGYDDEGYCIVDEDPDPSYSCESYESEDREEEGW